MSWKMVEIGSFLKERKGKFKPDDKEIQGLKRIEKIDFSGHIFLSDKSSKTNMILVKKGDLVISGINVAKGAMAIYSGKKDVKATIHYSSYIYNKDKIDVEFLNYFLKSKTFINAIKEQIPGGIKTEIKPKHILPLKVFIPTEIDEQRKIVEILNDINSVINGISTALSHQLTLVKKLRQAFLREAMQGKLLKSSPPLKEGWPNVGVVENKLNRFPQKEVVDKSINNLPYLKTFRKELRNNLTPAEAKLWTLIKGKRLEGRKFRRQFSVANYILDFYCPSENLAIELDGQGHFEASQAEYDYERDLFLNNYGIKVLRFENKWVWDNPEGLLEEIKRNFGWKENDPSVLRTASLEGEQLETGADLLAKIKAEKEQLIKKKKIKKQKPLPPITKEEIPFEIPESWVWAKLGELINFGPSNGFSPRESKKDTGIKCLTLSATTSGKFNGKYFKLVDENIPNDSYLWVKENDILLQRGNSLDFVGIAALCVNINDKYIYPDLMIKIRVGKYVDPSFIHQLLISPIWRKYFQEKSSGAQKSMPKINQNTVINTLVPLPPLSEQKRIVAKLDELMAYCDSLEESIKNSQSQNEMLLGQVLREALEPKGA